MRILESPRSRAAALVLFLVGASIAALLPFAAGLLAVPVLGALLGPLHDRLSRRLPPFWAAGVIAAALGLLVVVPVLWLVPTLAADAPAIIRSVVSSRRWAELAQIQIGGIPVGARVAASGGDLAALASQWGLRLVRLLTGATVQMGIALVGLVFLLPARTSTWAIVTALSPFSREGTETLRDHFLGVTRATLIGMGAVALGQGVLLAVLFTAVTAPHALFWAAIGALASVIPIVGSSLVWIPMAATLALGGRIGPAVAVVATAILVITQVDNLIRPMIFRRFANVSPLITLLGVFSGLRLFGPLGLVLGPLLLSYTLIVARMYVREYGWMDGEDHRHHMERMRRGELAVHGVDREEVYGGETGRTR